MEWRKRERRWNYWRLSLIAGTTWSLSAKQAKSLVVMKSWWRDLIRPSSRALPMPIPSAFSDPYAKAVSKWRYPAFMASTTAATVVSRSDGGSADVPIPITGMPFSHAPTVSSGILVIFLSLCLFVCFTLRISSQLIIIYRERESFKYSKFAVASSDYLVVGRCRVRNLLYSHKNSTSITFRQNSLTYWRYLIWYLRSNFNYIFKMTLKIKKNIEINLYLQRSPKIIKVLILNKI